MGGSLVVLFISFLLPEISLPGLHRVRRNPKLVLNKYENRKKDYYYDDEQGKSIHSWLIFLIIWISEYKSRGKWKD